MRVGIISDTHGLLRPEAIRHLAGTDHIIHAGDIGAPEVIEGLRRIAPTTAIRVNIDAGEWAKNYPDTELVVLGGRAFYVLHNLEEIKLDPARPDSTLSFPDTRIGRELRRKPVYFT